MSGAASIGATLVHADWEQWPVATDWLPTLSTFFATADGMALVQQLAARLAQGDVVYPPEPLRMLHLTALEQVRVVIVGQDPDHGPGQAEGLAFSVPKGVRVPPSLRNLYKELVRDVGGRAPAHGSLVEWARQGVLLLNTSLTVQAGQPFSHARLGWAGLTSKLLSMCNEKTQGVAFLLWGTHAQRLRSLVDERRHLVLSANHPSPLSATRGQVPFIGCGHFGQVNRWLASRGEKEIQWLADQFQAVA